MNKAERAYQALNEAADALDDLPDGVRTSLHAIGLGFMVNTSVLRKEATAITRRVNTAAEALEDANYDSPEVPNS